MNISRFYPFAFLAFTFIAATVLAQEENKMKIKRFDLPPAVAKTVAAQSRGATIRGFSEEKDEGQTYYEAELMVNGRRKDVLMDADGKIVEVEEQIAIATLPPAVRNGLQAKAGTDKILKVESLTKRGKLVQYEAEVVTNGKKSEVKVRIGPDGKPLDHSE
jgi:hypothetical protein